MEEANQAQMQDDELVLLMTEKVLLVDEGKLAEDGNKVILNGEYLWVYEEDGKLIMKSSAYENNPHYGQSSRNEGDSGNKSNISHSAESTPPSELDVNELMMAGKVEPANFNNVASEPSWQQAMKSETESVEKNNTWELMKLPVGKKAIGLKWVFKVKKDANGEMVKYKARIVAKGYVQQQGRDFDKIFAPVTRLEIVRLPLALTAKNSWEVHHLDVKSAFLNGEIQEEVYVTQPKGFVKKGKEHFIYRLVKSLYGLRQAPRARYAKLSAWKSSVSYDAPMNILFTLRKLESLC
ncbi:hypothetical protein AgCh_026307 [Apium graveolens]